MKFDKGDLLLHGIDIELHLGTAITAWDAKDYETVGKEIGRVSLALLNNGDLID